MKLLRLVVAGALVGTVSAGAVGGGFALALARREIPTLPDPSQLRTYVPALASEIRAGDGSLIARVADENRRFVPIAAIPPLVVSAFLSAEDRNFRRHHGIDVSALFRAALVKLRGGGRQIGGSTITQQVVKNLLVGDERTLRRKIREAVVALRLESEVGKDRILEIYLNEVYLGSGAYGVAAAADAYFGKPLDRLDAGEAALLAGMPKAPTAADPRRHPERARERRDYVLRRMAEDGAIDAAAARAFASRPVAVVRRRPAAEPRYGWFAAAAKRSLSERLGPSVVGRGGLQVRTTLDPFLQDRAEEVLRRNLVQIDRRSGWRGPEERLKPPFTAAAVPEEPAGADPWRSGVVVDAGRSARILLRDGRYVDVAPEGFAWTGRRSASGLLAPGDVVLVDPGPKPSLQQMPDVEGSMAVLDPRNGDVLAMVGGWSRARSEFDRASQARRQPGSSFKTFVYLAAVALGFDGSSPVLDVPIAIDQGPGRGWWRPSSESREGGMGLMPMRRALELSRNMASARLLNDVGMPTVESLLRRLGFDLPYPMPMSAALGTVETTPLSMAAGYAAIANGGVAVRPRFVAEVSRDSREIDPGAWSGTGERVVGEVDAAIVADELRGVVTRGTARGAFAGFPDPLGGKTGTTNDNKDAWFVGIAPNLVVATWIGRDDAKPLPSGASGGHTAAPVAREFLDAIRPKLRPEPFPLPAGARVELVDPGTGDPSARGVEVVVRDAPVPSDD
jgi:penicillin-binding protein 1A